MQPPPASPTAPVTTTIALGARHTWSRSRSVQWIIGSTAVVTLVLALAAPFLSHGGVRLWWVFGPIVLVTSAILLSLRLGLVEPAVRYGLSAIWLTLSLALFALGGLPSRASDGYVVLVVGAAIVWSVRAAATFAALSIAVMLAVHVADAAGVMPPPLLTISPFQMLVTTSALIVVGLVCMFVQERDTASKEQVARANEARIVSLVQQSPDALVFMDDQGRVQFMNDATEKLCGYTLADCIGRRFSGLPIFPEAVRERTWQAFEALIKGQENPGPRRAFIMHKAGHLVPVEVNSHRVQLNDGTWGVEYTIRDFSERARAEQANARLEEQLRQTQKIESVARLAGGVAHDFNNLLTVIMGQSELLLLQNLPAQPHGQVSQILKAADRARVLTQQLLAYARRQVVTPRRISPNAAILDLQALLESLAGGRVKLDIALDDNCGTIRIDPSQFDQVLTNLVANARDALPRGGTISIRSKHIAATESHGEQVEVLVHDDGVGIADEVRSKMFEPFFTTKGPGHGTGLGLAVVEGVLSQNGGQIVVESSLGQGSTFRLLLPASSDSASSSDRAAMADPNC